jgi:limonene-1,2-epoxide hydrolase
MSDQDVLSEAALAAKRFEEAYRNHDLDGVVACFTEDGVYAPGPFPGATGQAALRKLFTQWFSMMTVLDVEVHNVVVSGDTVVHERTDTCRVGGVEATSPVAVIYEVEGGRIAACREYFDSPTFDPPTSST